MNKGLEILMARMESNPDEFQDQNIMGSTTVKAAPQRWYPVFLGLARKIDMHEGEGIKSGVDTYGFVTVEEAKTVLNKYYEIQGEAFTTGVIKKLLIDPEQEMAEDMRAYASTGNQLSQQHREWMMLSGMQSQQISKGLLSQQGLQNIYPQPGDIQVQPKKPKTTLWRSVVGGFHMPWEDFK